MAGGGGVRQSALVIMNTGERDEELWELRHEVRELRRANERHRPGRSRPPEAPASRHRRARERPVRSYRARRRRRLLIPIGAVIIALVVILSQTAGGAPSFKAPTRSVLAGMSLSQRIVSIANSQVGYRTAPSDSYCNKFSAYWSAGSGGCPSGEASEKWCADFAAWVWQQAGIPVTYGYGPGQLNGGAVSFYQWGVDHGTWHPATDGYRAAPGDVALYGLNLGAYPTAAHVAVVTADPAGQAGPDVINGDGDRTGFSVVETGTDQLRADTGHRQNAMLDGYVSPT